MRLAKIIATLGPASQKPETIRNLLTAGVNIFRLNFSHGQHEILKETIATIRQTALELDIPTAILGDLQGPKFRIGELENHTPVLLEQGEIIRFTAENVPGNKAHLTTNTPQIIEELNIGDEVLMDDGNIAIQVIERISPTEIRCKVTMGGLLGEKKGINVPGLKMSNIAALTEKDKVDALFALQHDLDFIALSFVRSYHDILYLRNFIAENNPPGQIAPRIVAKIEKPQALDEIDAIIETTDAIMVARGDLGVELRQEKVPVIQKMLIGKANAAEKPVITATQMLESMIYSSTPTRAEVSDIANAVFDGTDALMLSGETAVGKYPVETVLTMARIIEEAESHYGEWHHRAEIKETTIESATDRVLKFHQAIAQAACYAARKAKTTAIVVLSYSGSMALRIAKRKPQKPIIALTPHQKIYRQLNLLWGVYPIKIVASETTDGTLLAAEQAILEHGLLAKRDPIVFCAGQTHLTGITNTLKMYLFGDVLEQYQLSSPQETKVPAAARAAQNDA
jgi:pyruvate kinase